MARRTKGSICKATKTQKRDISKICKREGRNSKACKSAKKRFCG